MPTDSETLLRIGIECESIEADTFGVARLVRKLLQELANRPELLRTHRFVLYFNRFVPGDNFLKSPFFETRITGLPRFGLPSSFSLYYYVLLPLRLWWDRPAVMYYPNYMLPLIHPPFVPSVVMLTEDVWHEMRNPKRALRYKAGYRVFASWAARTATRLMAISRSSAAELHRLWGIASERIRVNELAVDPPHPIHGATRTQPYLLFVGQAFERRHLSDTLAAFEKIAPRFAGLQFIFAGPDKYDPPVIDRRLQDINTHLGRQAVIHFPRVSDKELALLYGQASALVYISDQEGFGLPPLEALSYGIPVVVADTPVSREIFGDCAVFVKHTSDADAIASALASALGDAALRERIMAAAPDICARYTWSGHADRFLNILNETAHA